MERIDKTQTFYPLQVRSLPGPEPSKTPTRAWFRRVLRHCLAPSRPNSRQRSLETVNAFVVWAFGGGPDTLGFKLAKREPRVGGSLPLAWLNVYCVRRTPNAERSLDAKAKASSTVAIIWRNRFTT